MLKLFFNYRTDNFLFQKQSNFPLQIPLFNLKPNFLFYRGNLSDYATLDCVPLSAVKSSKYIIQVEDTSDGSIFYGEVNVVSDGTIAVATEYAQNYTTVFPFVEFGAEVIGGSVCLSAVALEGKDMSNFTFKGNRSNLFG